MPPTDTNTQHRQFSITDYLLWSLLALSFGAAYYPVWKSLVTAWMENENYSHGFVIVPLTLFLIWQQRAALMQAAGTGRYKGLLLVIGALLVYVFSLLGDIKTLASLSMIILFAGIIWYLWGYRLLRATLLLLVFLALMIPVPAQILAASTVPLQLLVTKIAGAVSMAAGIPVHIQGNLIYLPDQTFEVVEACSGLRSIMTLITLGVFLSVLSLNNPWKRGVLIVSSLPIAILVNSIRVLAMLMFSFYFNIDLLHGAAHTYFGLGIFIIALLLFFGVLKVLEKWQSEPSVIK